MATYAIGDVQGCFDELIALLKIINFDEKQDKLWFTGDLVNRGPKSLETLRFVKSLGDRAVTVLGNHDLHLLALAFTQNNDKAGDTLTAILTAPDGESLCHWLRFQPLLHYDETLEFVLVHAGLYPYWRLRQAKQYAKEVEAALQGTDYQSFLNQMYGNYPCQWDENYRGIDRLRFITNAFTRMRLCDREGNLDMRHKGSVSQAPPTLIPWFKVPHRSDNHLKIIFGHWAALEGKIEEENIYPLDTGCIWGNRLTAMCLENGEHYFVPCSFSQHKN